jgi:hypothetical protein
MLYMAHTMILLSYMDNENMHFMFSDEQVEEFRQLHEYCYEEPCSHEEAYEMCLTLLEIYNCVKESLERQARLESMIE